MKIIDPCFEILHMADKDEKLSLFKKNSNDMLPTRRLNIDTHSLC